MITPLYTPEQASYDLTRLELEKQGAENSEYFTNWISSVLGLSPEQEAIVRREVGAPEGRLEGLQSQIEMMKKYQTLQLNSGETQ